MTESDTESPPLEPSEAFALLGNETRIAIMEALARAEAPLGFNELRAAVGLRQGEQFNYHLDRLVGHFVEKRDDGYALRHPGRRVARAILAGTFTEDIVLEPEPIDEQCVYCGSDVEMSYDAGFISVRCTGCDGVVRQDHPTGTYMHYDLPPAGTNGRSREEIVDAAHVHYDSRLAPMVKGVCPECAHQVDVSHEVCSDHEPEASGLCPDCETRFAVWTTGECGHCRYRRRFATWFAALDHPAVVSVFHDHGLEERVPFRKLTADNAAFVDAISVSALETDPYHFRIAIPFEDVHVSVEMDDALDVVDVEC